MQSTSGDSKKRRDAVLKAAKAVKLTLRYLKPALEKAKAHEEINDVALFDTTCWHLVPYSGGRSSSYHVRKGSKDQWGTVFGLTTHSARLGVVIASLMNAFEAVTGIDLLDMANDREG